MTTTTAPAPVFTLTSSRRAALRAAGLVALIGALALGFVAQTFAGPTQAGLDRALQAQAQSQAQACSCS